MDLKSELIEYDQEDNAIYLYIDSNNKKVDKTISLGSYVNLDMSTAEESNNENNDNNNLVGIEIILPQSLSRNKSLLLVRVLNDFFLPLYHKAKSKEEQQKHLDSLNKYVSDFCKLEKE